MTDHTEHTTGEREQWGITWCSCGHITLRLGAVHKTFTPAQFAQLHRLLGEAMQELRIPQAMGPTDSGHRSLH